MSINSKFNIGSDLWPGTSKLIEEMGEVTQILGKLIATEGNIEHWDGSNLRNEIEDELGDLTAAIEFFIVRNSLSVNNISKRAIRKKELFYRWHNE